MHEQYLAYLPAELRPDPLPRRESRWWRWRNWNVHLERIGTRDAPVRLLMLHGAGGHAALLWPFAALAADRGFDVLVPDLPGYGRSIGPSAEVRYPDWVALVCDLVLAEQDERPLWILGASMGGLLGYDVASRTGLAAKVIATCLLDPRDPVARRGIGTSPRLGQHGPALLRIAAGPLARLRVPIRWLTNMRAMSNNPALTDLVCADPRGGGNRISLGFLRSFLDSAPAVEPEQVRSPEFLLAHPARDRWTPVRLSLPFFQRIAAPKRLVLLDDGGHLPIEAAAVRRMLELIESTVDGDNSVESAPPPCQPR